MVEVIEIDSVDELMIEMMIEMIDDLESGPNGEDTVEIGL